MNILFSICSLTNGGAERVAASLCKEWSANNKVCIVLTSPSKPNKYPLPPMVTVVELCKKRISVFRKARIFRQIIRSFKPDVIVSFLEAAEFVTYLANVGCGKPLVFSERNSPKDFPKSRFFRIIRLFLYHKASRVVFQTENSKCFFSRQIQSKGVVIPNPISGGLPMRDNLSSKTFICLGRLSSQKRFDIAIGAFSFFAKQHPDFSLEIWGDGELLESLRKQINDLSLSKTVFIHPFTNEAPRILSHSFAFLQTSDYEGIPNSMLEAMGIGIPCICTDCPSGGVRYLSRDGSSALLCPCGDCESIAKEMAFLVTNHDKYEELSKTSKYVNDSFSAGNIAKEWLSVFLDVSSMKN